MEPQHWLGREEEVRRAGAGMPNHGTVYEHVPFPAGPGSPETSGMGSEPTRPYSAYKQAMPIGKGSGDRQVAGLRPNKTHCAKKAPLVRPQDRASVSPLGGLR